MTAVFLEFRELREQPADSSGHIRASGRKRTPWGAPRRRHVDERSSERQWVVAPSGVVVCRHLEQCGDLPRCQASVRNPPKEILQSEHREHHEPVALVDMASLMRNDRSNLPWTEQLQGPFAQHDPRMEARNAVGHRPAVRDEISSGVDGRLMRDEVEKAAVPRPRPDRPSDEGPEDDGEHDAEVGRAGSGRVRRRGPGPAGGGH